MLSVNTQVIFHYPNVFWCIYNLQVNPGRFAPKPFPPLVVSPLVVSPQLVVPLPLVDSPLVYMTSSVVSNLGLNCLHTAKVSR